MASPEVSLSLSLDLLSRFQLFIDFLSLDQPPSVTFKPNEVGSAALDSGKLNIDPSSFNIKVEALTSQNRPSLRLFAAPPAPSSSDCASNALPFNPPMFSNPIPIEAIPPQAQSAVPPPPPPPAESSESDGEQNASASSAGSSPQALPLSALAYDASMNTFANPQKIPEDHMWATTPTVPGDFSGLDFPELGQTYGVHEAIFHPSSSVNGFMPFPGSDMEGIFDFGPPSSFPGSPFGSSSPSSESQTSPPPTFGSDENLVSTTSVKQYPEPPPPSSAISSSGRDDASRSPPTSASVGSSASDAPDTKSEVDFVVTSKAGPQRTATKTNRRNRRDSFAPAGAGGQCHVLSVRPPPQALQAAQGPNGQKPKPKQVMRCIECDETFTRRHDLLRHEVRLHGKVCEWVCSHCSKFFSSAARLKKHDCKPIIPARPVAREATGP